MKKVLYFLSAMALMAGFTACGDEKDPVDGGFENVVEDGFYVTGEATGATEITAEWGMAAGINEVDVTTRNGMFEKYVWLEGGKDFELVYYAAGKSTRYSSALEVPTHLPEGDGDQPRDAFRRGVLLVGADAPAMQVEETGFYHIVLDQNTNGDLNNPLILVAPARMGIRGDNNGWGFTEATMNRAEDGTITWVVEDVALKAGQGFKFAYGHGWKIQLDDAGNVKANTNLGPDMTPGGQTNILAEEKGIYKITLTYKNAGGSFNNSFSYKMEKTADLVLTVPENMYIIGNEFGNWNWGAAEVVTMTPVNGADGQFWAVRYMTTTTEFKFCSVKDWNGDFCTLGENSGFVTPNNNQVEADGLYLIYVDANGDGKILVKPAPLFALGDAFGGWDATSAGQIALTVNADGTASATATAAGVLRAYVQLDGVDPWKSEFSAKDGAIIYRGNAGDFNADNAVSLTAGQTVTFNFNAGTAAIQ